MNRTHLNYRCLILICYIDSGKKKNHGEICDCDLKCGHCIAKLDWTIDRLRQMWKVSYVDFDRSISKILEQDPSFINFDQLDNIYTCNFEKCFLIKN